MSYTNKTPNYDLPQYVGTDKPTYLGDFNETMLKIDSALHTNASNIASAGSTAETALNTAQTANTTSNNAQTTASQAQTTATNANTTAESANDMANSAMEDTQKIVDYLIFSETTLTSSGITAKTGTTSLSVNKTYTNLVIENNSTNSAGKISGVIQVDSLSNMSQNQIDISFNTPFRPSKSITLHNIGSQILRGDSTFNQYYNQYVNLTINTNGVASLSTYTNDDNATSIRIHFLPCLSFFNSII